MDVFDIGKPGKSETPSGVDVVAACDVNGKTKCFFRVQSHGTIWSRKASWTKISQRIVYAYTLSPNKNSYKLFLFLFLSMVSFMFCFSILQCFEGCHLPTSGWRSLAGQRRSFSRRSLPTAPKDGGLGSSFEMFWAFGAILYIYHDL